MPPLSRSMLFPYTTLFRSDTGVKVAEPKNREDWGRLMRRLGVKGIHIAERDTQRAREPKPRNVFINTWSVEGFVSEGLDRKSTRLNSSHLGISYAVFCLKK